MTTTFDFDDTLLMTRPDEDEGSVVDGPNMGNIALLRDLLDSDEEVHIVTSRHQKHERQMFDPWGVRHINVRGFLAEHGLLDRIAGIHFTNGDWKTETLDRLGSTLHFDDDSMELARLPKGCEGVLVPTPLWD